MIGARICKMMIWQMHFACRRRLASIQIMIALVVTSLLPCIRTLRQLEEQRWYAFVAKQLEFFEAIMICPARAS